LGEHWEFIDDAEEPYGDYAEEEDYGEQYLDSDHILNKKTKETKNYLLKNLKNKELIISTLFDREDEDDEEDPENDIELEDEDGVDLEDTFNTVNIGGKNLEFRKYDLTNIEDPEIIAAIDEEESEDLTIELPNDSLKFYGENRVKTEQILNEIMKPNQFGISGTNLNYKLNKIIKPLVDDGIERTNIFNYYEGVETDEEDYEDEYWEDQNWLHESEESFDTRDDDPEEGDDFEIEDIKKITKDDWLIELYKKTYERDQSGMGNIKEVTDQEIQNLEEQLTSSFKNLIMEKEEIIDEEDELINNLETAISSGSVYEVIGDVETDWAATNRIYRMNHENMLTLSESNLEEEFLNDSTENESNDDYDAELMGDIDRLQKLLHLQGGLSTPIEPILEYGAQDDMRRFGIKKLNIQDLDKRFENIEQPDLGWNSPLNNIREISKIIVKPPERLTKKDKDRLKWKIFKKTNEFHERFMDNQLRDWFLGMDDTPEELESYSTVESLKELVGGKKKYKIAKDKDEVMANLKQITNLNEIFFDEDMEDIVLGKKLKNIGKWEDKHTLDEFLNYFENKINESALNRFGGLEKIENNYIDSTVELGNDFEEMMKKGYLDSDIFLGIKKNKEFRPEMKTLFQIRQKSGIELGKTQEFKTVLGMFQEENHIGRDSFKLTNQLYDNKVRENFSTLLRKGYNTDIATKSRIKWKKLKKTYMNRLDSAERVLSGIINNLGPTKTEYNLDLKKPIENIIQQEQLKNELEKSAFNSFLGGDQKTILNFENTESFTLETIKQKDISKNLENYWATNSKYLDFKDILSNLKKKETLTHFDTNFKTFLRINPSNAIAVDEVNIIDPEISDYQTVETKKYLKEIAKGKEGLKRNKTEVTDEDFNELEEILIDDEEEIEEDEEEEGEDFYSRIRSNTVALMQSTKHDSVIPAEVLSAFLAKIPNIDLGRKLNEEIKKPFMYELEKKKIENNFFETKDSMENSKVAKFNFRLAKLNAPSFNPRSRIINEFGITRKHLRRPGAPLNNDHFRFSIHPFNHFTKMETLLERGLEYGMGDFVYKNNAVNRRSDVLQTRTFGPEIRLDSTIWGYGKIDKALTQNTNSEEDYGLLDGLGFPELVEQNIYDETNWAQMAYGGTPFSSKFTDFIWKNKILSRTRSTTLFTIYWDD